MIALFWSPRAISDVESIRDYIALDSPRYAELVVRRVIAAVEQLTAFPDSGRTVPELNRPEIRELIVRPYRVVYRHRSGVVEIVTVFHAARLFDGTSE